MKMDSDSHQQMDLRRFTLDDFRSADAAMNRCLRMARVVSHTDLPILILGESGTGKTLLAHAIHNSSNRAKGPFISFNAAALSDTLLDSQLFGHEKGAFTGAIRPNKVHPVLPEDLSLKTAEQNHIRKVLDQMQGNKRNAARLLGISRSTLDRKLSSE